MSEPGRLADRFLVVGPPFAESRSGRWWDGRDGPDGPRVAVKRLHPHRVGPDAVDEVRAALAATTRLDHPGVVPVLGVWAINDELVVASPWREGRSLRSYTTGLPPPGVARVARSLAEVLQHAHERGVVHGDVRAERVLLGRRLYLWGFGGRPSAREPRDVAPEVRGGRPPDVRSDVYGWARVVRWALLGERGIDRRGAWARHLLRVVASCEAEDPTRRPASMREVIARLDGAAPTLRAGFPGWGGRRRWVVWGDDPATGRPAVLATGLTGASAASMVARLGERGWRAQQTAVALGWRDLGWIGVASLVGAAGGPWFAAAGALLALGWRAWRCDPGLPSRLPPAMAPIPPIEMPPDTEIRTLQGVLLLFAAAGLALWPWLAVPPLAIVAILAVAQVTRPSRNARPTLAPRIEASLGAVRLAARRLPLDAELGVWGELAVLEARLADGSPNDAVLADLDALDDRVRRFIP